MRLLFFLLVLALLGAGTLLLRAPSTSPDDVVPTAGGSPASAASGEAALAPELASLTPRAEELGREAAARDALTAPASETTPNEARAATEASVEARVLGAAARPVPGAEVWLYRGQERPSQPGGTCDDEGRFVVEGAAGKARLEVASPGYVTLKRELSLGAGVTLDLGELTLVQGGLLMGRVVDRDGRGVAGARIQTLQDSSIEELLRGWDGWSEGIETDSRGHFTITDQAIGEYAYRVSHETFIASEFTGELSRAGDTVEGILVTLERGGAVEGRVTGLPEWHKEAAWRVSATPSRQDAWALGSGGGLRDREANLQPDGRFRLTGLDSGVDYNVWLEGFGHGIPPGRWRRSSDVPVRAGARGVQVAYSEGAAVQLRLVDEQGEPIRAAEVSAGFGWARSAIQPDEELTGGVARVDGLFPEEGGQLLQIEVNAPGMAPWTREVRIGPDEELDLGTVRLLARASLRVTVLTGEGDPLAGATVRAVGHIPPMTDGGRTVHRGMSVSMGLGPDGPDGPGDPPMPLDLPGASPGGETDDEGVCVLSVEEGTTVDVRVSHPNHPESRTGPLTMSSSGTVTEHLVRLATPGWVTVTVVDGTGRALPDVIVESRQDGGYRSRERQPATTGPDGTVTLGAFSAGPARFKVGEEPIGAGMISLDIVGLDLGEGETEGWTEATVVEGATTALTLVAPNRVVVTGVVTENGQPLAAARVVLASPNGPAQDLTFLGLGPTGPSTETDGRGEFRFDAVTQGKYELRVSHPTRVMDDRFDAEVEAVDTRFEMDLPVTLIEGRVLTPTGEPAKGARVSARRPKAKGQGMQSIGVVMVGSTAGDSQIFSSDADLTDPVRTDGTGRYSLRGVAGGVELIVTAQSDDDGSVESRPMVVDAGTLTQSVDLRFAEAGTVTVFVEDAVEGVMVMGSRPDGGAPKLQQAVEGRAVFKGLPPGLHVFDLIGGPGLGTVEPERHEVELEAGEEREVRFRVSR